MHTLQVVSLDSENHWVTAKPFFDNASLLASIIDAKSAYLDLKNGLLEPFFAPDTSACTLHNAFANSLI